MKLNLDGAVEWIIFSIALLMLPMFVIAARRHWQGRYAERALGSLWFKSPDLQSAHARGLAVLLTSGIVIMAGIIALFFIPAVPRGSIDYPGSIIFSIIVGIIVIDAVLYWCIILFNRPRLLVAPHLRNEDGLLRVRRRKRVGHVD